MARTFTISSEFTATDKYSRVLGSMRKNTRSFNKVAQMEFSKTRTKIDKTTQSSLSFSRSLARMGAGFGVFHLAKMATNRTLELDKAVTSAAGKFGIFDRESDAFKSISQKARELGASTEQSAGESANAIKILAGANFELGQALAGVVPILDLSTAQQTEFAKAASISTVALTQFGLKSKDSGELAQNLSRVTDVINTLTTKTEFKNIEQLETTFANGGKAVRDFGGDLETFGALVGSTIGATADASKTGTQMARAIDQLQINTKKLNKEGIRVFDKTGEGRNLLDIFSDIETVTKKMSDEKRLGFLQDVFGSIGKKAVTGLLEKGMVSVRDLNKLLNENQGITTEMATANRASFSGLSLAMKSAFEEVGISAIKTFQTEINSLIGTITSVARNTGIWINENKELIKTGASLVKWLLLGKIGFMALKKSIAISRTALMAYNAVMTITPLLTSRTLMQNLKLRMAYRSLTGATMAQAHAQKILNITSRLFSPVGLAITGVIIAATAGIWLYNKATDTATKRTAVFSATLRTQLVTETTQIQKLFKELRRTNPESKMRVRLTQNLTEAYPALINKQKVLKANNEELTQSEKELTSAIRKRIITQLGAKELGGLREKIAKKDTALFQTIFQNIPDISEKNALRVVARLKQSGLGQEGDAAQVFKTKNRLRKDFKSFLTDDQVKQLFTGGFFGTSAFFKTIAPLQSIDRMTEELGLKQKVLSAQLASENANEVNNTAISSPLTPRPVGVLQQTERNDTSSSSLNINVNAPENTDIEKIGNFQHIVLTSTIPQ